MLYILKCLFNCLLIFSGLISSSLGEEKANIKSTSDTIALSFLFQSVPKISCVINEPEP